MLEGTGVISRIKRHGTSNEYDLYPLVSWLEHLLEQEVPKGQDEVVYTPNDNGGGSQRTTLSSKEDPTKNKYAKRPFKKNVVLEGEVIMPEPSDEPRYQ